MAQKNNISVHAVLKSGQLLEVDENKLNPVVIYYKKKNLQPASNTGNLPGGINYMGIGIDFIVS